MPTKRSYYFGFKYLRQLILLLWDLLYVLFQVATASQFFISYTIRTFGALTFATIMTTRQVDIDSSVGSQVTA